MRWTRFPGRITSNGQFFPTNYEDIVTSDPHVYYTDEKIQLREDYMPPTGIGSTAIYKSKIEKIEGAPVTTTESWTRVETLQATNQDPDYRDFKTSFKIGDEGTLNSLTWTDSFYYTDVYLPGNPNFAIPHTHSILPYDTYLNSSDNLVENDASGVFEGTFSGAGGNSNAGTFEFRTFALKTVTAPSFNPLTSTTTITAHVYAYPENSTWLPDEDMDFQIDIFKLSEPGSPIVRTHTGQILKSAFSRQPDGKFATISWVWDGRDDSNEVVSGSMRADVRAFQSHGPALNFGQSMSIARRTFSAIIPAPPLTEAERRLREPGCNSNVNSEGQLQTSLSLTTGFSGPTDSFVSLTARSANTDNLPASFGHGWGLSRNEYIAQSASGNQIIHYHDSNRIEVWELNAGVYEPAFPNNYTSLELVGSSFLMSFKDKRKKSFHPLSDPLSGKLHWEEDRNGNRTYFHYNSNLCLEAWSDAVDSGGGPDGRVVRFEYPVDPPNTSCLQPIKMVSELRLSGVPVASRETTFTYYESTDASMNKLQDRLATVTNPEGETTTFEYYATSGSYQEGKLFRVRDARGHLTTEYTYYNDTNVRVETEKMFSAEGVAELQRDYNYSYLGNQNITQITTTDQTPNSLHPTRETFIHYNNDRRQIKKEETIGLEKRTTEYLYGDSNNPYKVTRVTDHNFEYEERTYNDRGNVTQVRNKNGEITNYTYVTGDNDLVKKIQPPLVTVPDPNNPGQTVQEQYEISFTYDTKNNLSSITQTGGAVGANVPKTTYFRLRNGVDNASEPNPSTDGQVWKIVDRRWDGVPANEENYATVFDYHDNGNLKSIEGPVELGSHPRRKLEFDYDDFDNLISVKDLLGNEFKSIFDNLDRLIESEDARGKKAYFDYTDGLMLEAHSPSNLGPSGVQERDIGNGRFGRTSKMTYDYRGRMTKQERSDSTTTFEIKAEYQFTGFSEVYTLVRYLNGTTTKETTWSYDELGRVKSLVDSLGRSSSRDYEVFCKEYDSISNRNVTIKSTFDALCRPKMLISDSEDQERSYDELGRLVSIIQNEKSRYSNGTAQNVTGRRFGTATYEMTTEEWKFEYDPLGRMTRAEYPGGEEILYEYGDADELLKMTDTDGKVTRYTYNQDLSLKEVILERTPSDKTFTYTYDAGGRVTKIEYPDDLELLFDDGTNPGWDANGQLTYMRYVKPSNSSLVRSFQYAYDDSGNRTQMIESNGTSAQDIEWQYRYDWQDRLVQVSRGVGGATPDLLREYVFDESDNRTYMDVYDPANSLNDKTFWYSYKTVGSGMSTKYSDELAEMQVATGAGKRMPADQADFSSLETFVSDDDGNITSRTTTAGTVSYNWDDLNNLISVKLENGELTRNLYDAGSIREEMVKNSGEKVKSFYSGLPTVNETTTVANGNISYFMGHQLLGYEKNGTSYYYITDGLSSVRAVINDAGTETASFEHDEFGNELSATGSSTKTWVGGLGVHDDTADTRLLYMRRRHYDPSIGRFLNRDPIGLAGGYNLFNYASNNPVHYVDPEGTEPIESQGGAAVGGALGAGTGIAPPPTAVVTQGGGASMSSGRNPLVERALKQAVTRSPQALVIIAPFMIQGDDRIDDTCPQNRQRWTCRARCNNVDNKTLAIVKYSYGLGHGPTKNIAYQKAEAVARSRTPIGFRTRHCRRLWCRQQ